MRDLMEKAAGMGSGGGSERTADYSGRNRVAAFPVLGLGREDGQAHFLAKCSADETAYGMRLPVRRFHDRLQRDAAGLLHKYEDRFGLAALALRGGFGLLCCPAGLLVIARTVSGATLGVCGVTRASSGVSGVAVFGSPPTL